MQVFCNKSRSHSADESTPIDDVFLPFFPRKSERTTLQNPAPHHHTTIAAKQVLDPTLCDYLSKTAVSVVFKRNLSQ